MGQLYFKKRFQDAIRAGSKRTTIRRWGKPPVQAGKDAYVPGFGWLCVEEVEPIELATLGEADARADGFETRADLLKALEEMYPNRESDGKSWFRVMFRMREPLNGKGDGQMRIF